jgi:hypothetical protein
VSAAYRAAVLALIVVSVAGGLLLGTWVHTTLST